MALCCIPAELDMMPLILVLPSLSMEVDVLGLDGSCSCIGTLVGDK
jgi:hypothetical protein